jgi:Uma2 family endonuclease
MTGMGTTTGLMSFAEFERLPDDEQGYKLELLDGELIRMPPPKLPHTEIERRLHNLLTATLARLHDQGQASDLGVVYTEAGYHLRDSYLIPDVSVTHAGRAKGDYLEGAPAIAIEVISASNRVETMQRKILRYFEHGAREVWVFHPTIQLVTVHYGDHSVEVRDTLTTALFPGLAINLAEIFAA